MCTLVIQLRNEYSCDSVRLDDLIESLSCRMASCRRLKTLTTFNSLHTFLSVKVGAVGDYHSHKNISVFTLCFCTAYLLVEFVGLWDLNGKQRQIIKCEVGKHMCDINQGVALSMMMMMPISISQFFPFCLFKPKQHECNNKTHNSIQCVVRTRLFAFDSA